VTRFAKEFRDFINRGSVLDLAVGIVIGVAFSAVINSFVDDILNAIIGAIVGKPNFDDLTLEIGDGVVRYGAIITAVVYFVIVAFAGVVYRASSSGKNTQPAVPAPVWAPTEGPTSYWTISATSGCASSAVTRSPAMSAAHA
jgi:large conductance mechanosensitive channel